MEDDFSGLAQLDDLLDRLRFGASKPKDGYPFDVRLYGYSYGWPTETLGVVIQETNAPGRHTSTEILVGIDCDSWWPRSPSQPIDFHVVPLFPLVGQSLVGGSFYAMLLWFCFGLRPWLRRRNLRQPCPECGYELSGLPASVPCPECGHITDSSQSDGPPQKSAKGQPAIVIQKDSPPHD